MASRVSRQKVQGVLPELPELQAYPSRVPMPLREEVYFLSGGRYLVWCADPELSFC